MKKCFNTDRGHDDGGGKRAIEEDSAEVAVWEDRAHHARKDAPLIENSQFVCFRSACYARDDLHNQVLSCLRQLCSLIQRHPQHSHTPRVPEATLRTLRVRHD
jgi:hypothetical protein